MFSQVQIDTIKQNIKQLLDKNKIALEQFTDNKDGVKQPVEFLYDLILRGCDEPGYQFGMIMLRHTPGLDLTSEISVLFNMLAENYANQKSFIQNGEQLNRMYIEQSEAQSLNALFNQFKQEQGQLKYLLELKMLQKKLVGTEKIFKDEKNVSHNWLINSHEIFINLMLKSKFEQIIDNLTNQARMNSNDKKVLSKFKEITLDVLGKRDINYSDKQQYIQCWIEKYPGMQQILAKSEKSLVQKFKDLLRDFASTVSFGMVSHSVASLPKQLQKINTNMYNSSVNLTETSEQQKEAVVAAPAA